MTKPIHLWVRHDDIGHHPGDYLPRAATVPMGSPSTREVYVNARAAGRLADASEALAAFLEDEVAEDHPIRQQIEEMRRWAERCRGPETW